MDCMYAMGELGLPFEERTLFHANMESLEATKAAATIDLPNGKRIVLGPGRVRSDDDLTPHGFFTLRVCKDCRADWMESIRDWFNTKPESRETGSGIYFRHLGTNREEI